MLAAVWGLCSWTVSEGNLLAVGEGECVPQAPDYHDVSQWYIVDRGGVADLFYVISTETADYVNSAGDTCHYADTYNPSLCRNMLKEMHAVDSLFSGRCNYFSPYYRQISMQSWASQEMALQRIPLALEDVHRSWAYYLEHLNQGRPFILAGFSQGAHAIMDIMKRMPPEVARRMVAAYPIGYKVTQADLDSFPQIRAAEGATDVGVTVNFNSVRSPECAIGVVSDGNVLCINPVNWRTDTVTALLPIAPRFTVDGSGLLTVQCDPETHLLIIGNYGDKKVMPVIGVPGNYHHRELQLYPYFIRRNIADRVRAYELERFKHSLDDD